ncbi:MAG: hypothetical protein ABIG34_04315 [Candidatus Peregrinibacteria bacterium]
MSSALPHIVRPELPTGREIYDILMASIEPDLVVNKMDALDQLYAQETPSDHRKRMKRYRKAFEEYDRQYAEYMRTLSQEVTDYRRSSCRALEEESRAEETTRIASIERSMNSQN